MNAMHHISITENKTKLTIKMNNSDYKKYKRLISIGYNKRDSALAICNPMLKTDKYLDLLQRNKGYIPNSIVSFLKNTISIELLEKEIGVENLVKYQLPLHKYSLLHIASERGNKKTVKYLLENNAPIDVESYMGDKPIHNAVVFGCKETVKTLLDRNSEQSNMEDFYGITPLHIAVISENLEITDLLLQYGANPIHKSKVKILLSLLGNDSAIEKMNSRIAFIRDKYGMLAEKSQNSLKNFLLTNYTQTPLNVALDRKNEEIIAKLLKAVKSKIIS